MRQIFFRGRDINGDWHIGLLAQSAGFPNQPPEGVYISNTIGAPYAYKIIPETIGQFTGLTDRTGKEICEGDIITITNSSNKTIVSDVRFLHGAFCVKTFGEYFPMFSLARPGDVLEVIGDIYQNPELLSEKTEVKQ